MREVRPPRRHRATPPTVVQPGVPDRSLFQLMLTDVVNDGHRTTPGPMRPSPRFPALMASESRTGSTHSGRRGHRSFPSPFFRRWCPYSIPLELDRVHCRPHSGQMNWGITRHLAQVLTHTDRKGSLRALRLASVFGTPECHTAACTCRALQANPRGGPPKRYRPTDRRYPSISSRAESSSFSASASASRHSARAPWYV